MKKLVIKEISDTGGKVREIEIVEQTHLCNYFGDNDRSFYHKGFSLKSSATIQAFNDGLFVLGSSSEINGNRRVSVISKIWLKKLKEAVKAYNEYFCNCDKCIDRKCNSCPIGNK